MTIADIETTETAVTDPTELLPHYDMFDPAHEAAKWELFAHAREHCPVFHTDVDDGAWVVTRYEDVRSVLEDPTTFSSTGVAPRPSPVKLNPLDADPPIQTDLRKLLNPLFSRNALSRHEPEMRKLANATIDAWIDAGTCDFIADFAAPYVGGVLARVVFDEDDPSAMQRAIDTVTQVALTSADEDYFNLAVLGAEYLSDRTDNPVEKDDILGAILRGTVDGGRPLTEDEALGIITVLFLGGLDTTRGAIGSIAFHCTQGEGVEARLRDPDWVRWDMDEFIRLESPVACLGRRVMADTELAGQELKQGEQVLLRYDSANRDEAQFPNASDLRFDVLRSGHAGFGMGIHRCLGVHLARFQITVAFEELFKRITNLRLVDDWEVHWAPGIANGPEHLPITFDRT